MSEITSKTFISGRRLLVTLSGHFDLLLRHQPQVAVLCYHSISDDKWLYSINPDTFEKHIDFLSRHYQFISLDDLYQHLVGTKLLTRPSVVITFDDGYRDLLSVAPFLKKYHIKPTIFVLSHPHKANRQQLDTNRSFLNWKQLHQLKHLGWTIGCHSATHPDFNKLNNAQMVLEISRAKKVIENKLGITVKYFAYPKGTYSAAVKIALKQSGFLLGLSMDHGVINANSDLLILPRVGVDRSHTLSEFRMNLLPTPIKLKHYLSKLSLADVYY